MLLSKFSTNYSRLSPEAGQAFSAILSSLSSGISKKLALLEPKWKSTLKLRHQKMSRKCLQINKLKVNSTIFPNSHFQRTRFSQLLIRELKLISIQQSERLSLTFTNSQRHILNLQNNASSNICTPILWTQSYSTQLEWFNPKLLGWLHVSSTAIRNVLAALPRAEPKVCYWQWKHTEITEEMDRL